MRTEIVKYVDPDGGILADYTSLQAAITAEKAIRSDLVARDEVLKLMCISSAGSPDTTPVVINSGDFVTDATRKLLIQGDNNIGIWDNSKYRLIVAASICIIPNISNIQIYNMQFANNNNFIATIDINNATVSNIIINNNIFTTAGATGQGIEVNSSAGNIYLINNVLYGMRQGIVVFAAGGSVYIYNNTINATELGIIGNASATVRAKNNISNGSSDNYFSSFHVSSDYNISNLAGDAPGANSLNSTTVNFADASGGDFRLLAGSPGIDQGVDLSSDPNFPFNTDIIGTVRPQGAAWDIGAFEYVDPFIYQDLTAKIEAQTSVRASLSKKLELAGVFDAATQLKSLLVIDRNFSAIIKTDSAITAQAVKVIALSGDIRSLSDLKLSLSADRRFAGRIESFSMISARLSLPVLIEEISLNAPGLTVVDLSAPGNNILNLKASYL